MRRISAISPLIVAFVLVGCADESLTGLADADSRTGPALDQRTVFPEVVPLPDGFQPEGIAIGPGTRFYVGSLADGAIYGGDLRTGAGSVVVPGAEGRISVGLDLDARSGLLWVAGGSTGHGYVYDVKTGASVADFDFEGGFVNDVVVTQKAAYFTDSFEPVLYKVAHGPGGSPSASFEEITLGGDFDFIAATFNTNGIVATPDGKTLIIVNSFTGTLYAVDPESGVASAIDLGGDSVPSGDGLLLDGRHTLYVAQNFLNQISVVALSQDLASGVVVDVLTDPDFRVPTTVADFGNALYAVNARFDVAPTPDTEYEIVRLLK